MVQAVVLVPMPSSGSLTSLRGEELLSLGCCLWACFKDRMEREGSSSPAQCRAAGSDTGTSCKLIPDLFPACCSQPPGSCQTPIPGHAKHGERQRCSSLPSAARDPWCPRTAAVPGSWLTSMSGVSSRNLLLTDTRASSGHSWNQSMAVQLTTAGNLLARTRRVEPTGEKQRTTWGRTAVAEWGVPTVRVGGVSPEAPHDCKDSAADQRFSTFPLTPSRQEVVCGCAPCASHHGWNWVSFGGHSQQLSTVLMWVSLWPWKLLSPLCPRGGQYRAVLPCASGAEGTWGVSENLLFKPTILG